MKALRIYAASLALMLAAILAHILAGGQVISFHSGAILALVAFVLAMSLESRFDQPGYVALAIFISQNLSHFLLGGSSAQSLEMPLCHIASGFLSYKLIQFFIKSLPSITEIFTLYLLPRISATVEIIYQIKLVPSFSYRSLSTRNFSHATALRAPPVY